MTKPVFGSGDKKLVSVIGGIPLEASPLERGSTVSEIHSFTSYHCSISNDQISTQSFHSKIALQCNSFYELTVSSI